MKQTTINHLRINKSRKRGNNNQTNEKKKIAQKATNILPL